jgi:putative FmdB family regulatory protein
MPIYEYQCGACGARHEILQKISDPPATECPACKAGALQKLVSAAGFRLKGTGWYVTDFRDKKSDDSKTSSKPNEGTKAESVKSESSTQATKESDSPSTTPKAATD